MALQVDSQNQLSKGLGELMSPKGTPLSNRGYMSEANAPTELAQSADIIDPKRVAHRTHVPEGDTSR